MAKFNKKYLNKTIRSEIDNSNNLNQIYSFLSGVLVLYFIHLAYFYLDNLKLCSCVNNQQYVNNIKNAETTIMAFIVIGMALNFTLVPYLKNYDNKTLNIILWIMVLYSIFVFSVYIYFIYNVYKFKNSYKNNCECAMKWQRWIVFIQYGLYLISIIMILMLFFIGFFM
jgi:hypothetical protein